MKAKTGIGVSLGIGEFKASQPSKFYFDNLSK